MSGLLQNKLLTFLFAVALLLGIVAEGLTIFRQYIGAETDLQNLAKTKIETCVAKLKGRIDLMTDPASASPFELGDCGINYKEKHATATP